MALFNINTLLLQLKYQHNLNAFWSTYLDQIIETFTFAIPVVYQKDPIWTSKVISKLTKICFSIFPLKKKSLYAAFTQISFLLCQLLIFFLFHQNQNQLTIHKLFLFLKGCQVLSKPNTYFICLLCLHLSTPKIMSVSNKFTRLEFKTMLIERREVVARKRAKNGEFWDADSIS